MSYEYETSSTFSTGISNSIYSSVSTTIPPLISDSKYSSCDVITPAISDSIYSSVDAVTPAITDSIYSCVGTIAPVISDSIYSSVDTVTPLISDSIYSCVGTTIPLLSDSIYSSVDTTIPPLMNDSMYSCVDTTIPSLVSDSIYSCVDTTTIPSLMSDSIYSNVSTIIAPLINPSVYSCIGTMPTVTNNSVYTPAGTTSPVTFNHVNSVGSTSTPNNGIKRKVDDSLQEQSFEGKRSRISLEYSGYSQSSSNDSLNISSDVDKFSLVDYNKSPTTKACGRDNKAGWYDIHERHLSFAQRSRAIVVLFGDSIIDGLTRYSRVWSRHFKPLNALNCGIGGDRTQHVLWRAEKMVLPDTVRFVVLHCGTNNIDRDTPKDIANGIISCGLVLQEKKQNLQIILTGLLPRDLEPSMRRSNIITTNKYIKKFCQKFDNFTYMKQDSDWTLDNGILNEYLYYIDHLHLVETGNNKFAESIINIITKLSKNEEIVYSADESENDSFNFERKVGESRNKGSNDDSFNRFNRRNIGLFRYERNNYERNNYERNNYERNNFERNNYDNQNPYKFERKHHSEPHQKRKRSASPVDNKRSASPPVEEKPPAVQPSSQEEDPNCDYAATPKKYHIKRKWNSVVKTEFHGQFSLSKELRDEKIDNNLQTIQSAPEPISTIPLAGVAKSIDINMADKQRLEARKAKFGGNPVGGGSNLKRLSDLTKAEMRGSNPPKTSAPSALVLKIRRSMEQAREELSKKKLMVSAQGRSKINSSIGESTPAPNKKIISHYGSGSDDSE